MKGAFKKYSFLAMVIISLIVIQSAHADVFFNNSHPTPGDTISFSGKIWICDNGYHRVLIKEPSGRYIPHPDFLNVSIVYAGKQNYCYKLYNISGKINVNKDFVPGNYSLVFDFTSSLSDYVVEHSFTVGNYTPIWKYQTSYPGGNWNGEVFDDSSWQSGFMPFGNPNLFPQNINTSWTNSIIYLRKDFYLDSFTQANLKMFAENNVECWVNGHDVGNHESIHALKTDDCYRNIIAYYGDAKVQATESGYRYNGVKFVDISKYLRPGKNVIACRAEIFNNVYRNGRLYHWTYYPGRQFVDVEFLPLQQQGIFWTQNMYNYNVQHYWNSPNVLQTSYYWEYQCETVGHGHTYNRYVKTKDWYGSWQWNNVDITDDSTFYAKPEHFNWDNDYNDKTIYWGTSPFNGHLTYFRKWIWSDKNEYAVLKLSATKKPTCYLNGKQINVEPYNTSYWNYYFDIRLNQGANLLACSENPSQFSIFDLATSGFDGKLRISNVSVENSDDGINLSVELKNLAHPEVQLLLGVDVDNNSYTKKVSSAQISTEDDLQNLNVLYSQDWFENIISVNYKNVSYGNRASDRDWGTYAYLRNRNRMQIEKTYQLSPNLTLNKLKFKYKYEGEISVYFYNYKTNNFEYITTSKNQNPTTSILEVPNATDYVSPDGNVKFKVNVMKGQFSQCNSWGCYVTYSNAYYYEDELYAKGIQAVYANFTRINSNTNVNLFVPLEPGAHNITVSAIDLIDGDIDIFSSKFNILAKPAEKVGFLPVGGNSQQDSDIKAGNGNVIIIAATSAIASASVAIAYLAKGKSTSLKRLETSLSKAEKIVSRLEGYRSTSLKRNKYLFFKSISDKYALFKEHLDQREREEKRVEGIREYLRELERQAKLKFNKWSSKIVHKLLMGLSGSNEKKIRQIDEFLSGHELNYKDAQVLLKERAYLFGKIFGIDKNEVKKLVKEFAKTVGLTGYVHLGRYTDQLRLILDDPNLRGRFKNFLKMKSEKENSNDATSTNNPVENSQKTEDGASQSSNEVGIGQFIKNGLEGLWNGIVNFGKKAVNFVTDVKDWVIEHPKETVGIVTAIVATILLALATDGVSLLLEAATGVLGTSLFTIGSVDISIGSLLELAAMVGVTYTSADTFFSCGRNPNSPECKAKGEESGSWIVTFVGGELVFRVSNLIFKGFELFKFANRLKDMGYSDETISKMLVVLSKYGDDGIKLVSEYGLNGFKVLSMVKDVQKAYKILKTFEELDDNAILAFSKLDLSVFGDDFLELMNKLGIKRLLNYLANTSDINKAAKELIDAFNRFKEGGVSIDRLKFILDYNFNGVKFSILDNAPFAVTKEGVLLINPQEIGKISDTIFKFSILHEQSEIIKMNLVEQGKILSDNAIWDKINQLKLTYNVKQELYDTITDRLIADKIALKTYPDSLKGWKEESSKLLIWLDSYDTSLPVPDRYLVRLAYLKALAPDGYVITKVEGIVGTFDKFVLSKFNNIYDIMRLVIKNV